MAQNVTDSDVFRALPGLGHWALGVDVEKTYEESGDEPTGECGRTSIGFDQKSVKEA